VTILPFVKMRVVIADDSVLPREDVSRLLGEAGFEVVGQADDAEVSEYEPKAAPTARSPSGS
jgi:AmiR/NasT family two-component response regulator